MALSDRFKKYTNNNYEQLYKEPEKKEVSAVNDVQSELREALSEKIASIPVWHEYTPETQRDLISNFISSRLSSSGTFISEEEKSKLISACYSAALGFGVIDSLIMHEDVNTVFVNGTEGVFFELDGEKRVSDIKLDDKQLEGIKRNLFAMRGLPAGNASNILNFRYNNFSISAVMPEISSNGLLLTVKRRSAAEISPQFAVENSFLTQNVWNFLNSALTSKKSILILGPGNSGKTFLVDLLLKNLNNNVFTCVFEDFIQLFTEGHNISKFELSGLNSANEFNLLYSSVMRTLPEYLFFDLASDMYLSSIIENIYSSNNCTVLALRSPSFDAVSNKLVAAIEKVCKFTEKQAKIKAFSLFDYVVELETIQGRGFIKSVLEVAATKTTLSFKEIYNYSDNELSTETDNDDFPDIAEEDLLDNKSKFSSRFSQL